MNTDLLKDRRVIIGLVIVVVIAIFAFVVPKILGGTEDADPNANLPVPSVQNPPGEDEGGNVTPEKPMATKGSDAGMDPDKQSSRSEKNREIWFASAEGFADNFCKPAKDINEFLKPIKEFATPELINRMKTIDPRNLPECEYLGLSILKYGDTEVYVQAPFKSGNVMKLHLSQLTPTKWLVDTYSLDKHMG